MFITNMEYKILNKDYFGLFLEINSKYTQKWDMCGVTINNISQKDKERLIKILF